MHYPFVTDYCIQHKPLLINIDSYYSHYFELYRMNCHTLVKGTTPLTLSKPSTPQTPEMFYFMGHHQYKL